MNAEKNKVKYSTYIDSYIAEAIRNFSHAKKVSAGFVIESAIKKCIPESYLHPNKSG